MLQAYKNFFKEGRAAIWQTYRGILKYTKIYKTK